MDDSAAKLRIVIDNRTSPQRLATRSTNHIYNTPSGRRGWKGEFDTTVVTGLTTAGCNIGTANGTFKVDWDTFSEIPDGVTYTAFVEQKTSDTYPGYSTTPPIVFSGRITTTPST